MLALTKRQFVRLAAVSITDRIFPRWLRTEPSPRNQNKVIIVTFGGGVQYAETFSPEGVRNIPRLLELKPRGYFYRNCVNAGVLSHFNSTASIGPQGGSAWMTTASTARQPHSVRGLQQEAFRERTRCLDDRH
jgi:hypothetical protein